MDVTELTPVAILLPILGATLALSGLLLVFLLCVFLGFRLLHHILEQTQDAAAIDGILSGLRAWVDETKVRVGLLPPPPQSARVVSLEGKPFMWEAGDTPRGFGFPQAAGFPNEADDDVTVKTEKAEDSDWVSDADADAEAPMQSTPRVVRSQGLAPPAPGTQAQNNSSPSVPSPLNSESQPQQTQTSSPSKPPQSEPSQASPPQPQTAR